jgi:integrase
MTGREACQRAGCPGRRLHDCRRTAARNLRQAGVPEDVAMKLTGPATRDVFRRYASIVDDDLRNGADRLAEHLQAQPTRAAPRRHAG